MHTTHEAPVDLRRLGARLAGDVVLPEHESWDGARKAWNLAVDPRPAAVVYPESADDMVAVVQFAAEHGLQIAFIGGGHNPGPIGWHRPALMVKTERLKRIDVEPASRRVRLEAGVLADELAAAAGGHGLAYLAGTSPDVGVVGYVLGGGIGWMVRKYGLACNSLVGAEVVTADGRLVRADAANEPDLFWALRGGGGNFGAVAALELQLVPVRELYAGCLFWPIERAHEILAAWREWTDTVSDECTSLGRLLKLPDLEFIPEHLRTRSFVLVEPAFVGPAEEGAVLIAPLRALGPEFDTVEAIPTSRLSTINMDPAFPVPYVGEGIHLAGLDEACIDRVVDLVVDSPLIHFEIRHLGGVAALSSPDHGALDAIDAPFTTFAFGLALDTEMAGEVGGALNRLHAELAPWDSGFRYLNFAESPMDAETIYPPASYRRLCALKGTYDPDHRFVANHPIRAVA